MSQKKEFKPKTVTTLKLVKGDETPRKLIVSSEGFVSGFKPPEYQIDGLVQRRYIYSMTAPTGGGKTAILLYLSALVGLGQPLGSHEVEKGRVLYLAGENPDDTRYRWMAMAEKMEFDINDIGVSFIEGPFSIRQLFDRLAADAEEVGGFDLIIVDTSAAYYDGVADENSNVQMGEHARMLRRLTTLPGEPCVIVACHPTKNAGSENLQPRGGGAFIAEMDGNFTCVTRDLVADLHWQGKLRGPDFSPIGFQLVVVTAECLKDLKGRYMPTILAKLLTEQVRIDIKNDLRKDEDALLTLMNLAPGGTQTSMAQSLGWIDSKGQPQRYRVSKAVTRLKNFGFAKLERDELVLTEKGKEAARKAG